MDTDLAMEEVKKPSFGLKAARLVLSESERVQRR